MKHEELLAKYARQRRDIEARLAHFESVGRKGGRALFEELCFCLLTPQSKARSCDAAIHELKEKKLLFGGDAAAIAKVLSTKTRFHNNKAGYLVEAREKFAGNDFALLSHATFTGSERHAREYFLKNVKGLGLKEASHYLRNVGRGKTLAILDRHILKNLVKCGAIERVPASLTEKRYLEIEKKMEKFCKKTGVPLAHLDLLFWAEETGEIFK
ncbi:MAG: N-glycosylase/DNA lyase [Candidatus Micrarchaeota archaeon]|nr:N-glycosylase/DNA lyase [Candidatus Micrarchaeota archaeon]